MAKKVSEPEEVLNREGVAELFRCSVRIIDRAIDSGCFPQPVKIGPATLRWSRKGLLEWLASGGRLPDEDADTSKRAAEG